MKKKLVVAIGLAAIAVLSLYLYTRSVQEEVGGGQKVTVLVAAEEIPAGTRVTKKMLAQRAVPEAYVHQSSIRFGEENSIIGRPVSEKINVAQQLLWSDFEMQKSASSRRLSGAVPKGQRALTFPVDLSGSMAGMLRPGDHIDLLGTFARGQGPDWATVTLLQNVLVIATGDVRGAARATTRCSRRAAPRPSTASPSRSISKRPSSWCSRCSVGRSTSPSARKRTSRLSRTSRIRPSATSSRPKSARRSHVVTRKRKSRR